MRNLEWSSQRRALTWYHHYLQHPGHTRLEDTLKATMTWTGMRDMVRRHAKRCRSCQRNKKRSKQYGHVPPKNVTTNPCEALCVNLICPCVLKGKGGSVLDFICLTVTDPATGWFEMVELSVIEIFKTYVGRGGGGKIG